MKTQAEIEKLLFGFSMQYGIDVLNAAQGSEAWFKVKLGVLSASNASKIVAKPGSETRLSYMAELAAQICTGIFEEINAKAMEWGKAHEDAARAYYEFQTGSTVVQVPFVFKDEKCREGCSPDGLIFVDHKGQEIKCPYNTANYIKFLCEEKIKTEWVWQNQFSMRQLNATHWDFGQYDPRMKSKPLHFVTIERDEAMQKTLADAVPQFIHELDQMLAKAGVTFGDQWLRLKAQGAA